MKKTESKFALLAALIAILAFASIPLWQNNLNSLRPQTHTVKKKKTAKKKKVVHVTWGYPFKKLYEKKIKFKSGQKFGETDVIRRVYPSKSYFHDGYDFGFSEVGHSSVYAVHAGTVHRVKYAPGLGLYIWIISDDGYVEVYQEGFLSITDIYVKKGQKVKLGQKIGKLTGSHIHLGVTKTDKDYIDKKPELIESYNNGKEIKYNQSGNAEIKKNDFYIINDNERAEQIKQSGLAEVEEIKQKVIETATKKVKVETAVKKTRKNK